MYLFLFIGVEVSGLPKIKHLYMFYTIKIFVDVELAKGFPEEFFI